MTEKEYRAADGISRSQLWKIAESPEKFIWAQEHPEEPTTALLFGQAAHKMMLEPEKWDEDYVVAPFADRRTKEGKQTWIDFLESVNERSIITEFEYSTIIEMSVKLLENKYIQKLLSGPKEEPISWTDELTGELCKARMDCVAEVGDKTVIVDYKTTADASTDAFMRSAVKYGYDFQAAMYIDGYKAVTGKDCLFVFIAQEKTPPYAFNILQADDVFIRRGRDIFRQLLGIYHDCKKTGNWWGYLGPYNMVNNLALPAWLAKEVE